MDEGKTEVDGETTLNWSTTIDQIGSSYKIWAVKGGANNDDTVLFATEANNTVEEFITAANLTKSIEMKTNASTEYYVNFESSVTTSYEAIYRIEFAIKAPTEAKADEYVAAWTSALTTRLRSATPPSTWSPRPSTLASLSPPLIWLSSSRSSPRLARTTAMSMSAPRRRSTFPTASPTEPS
jgi:hypothetical protein